MISSFVSQWWVTLGALEIFQNTSAVSQFDPLDLRFYPVEISCDGKYKRLGAAVSSTCHKLLRVTLSDRFGFYLRPCQPIHHPSPFQNHVKAIMFIFDWNLHVYHILSQSQWLSAGSLCCALPAAAIAKRRSHDLCWSGLVCLEPTLMVEQFTEF